MRSWRCAVKIKGQPVPRGLSREAGTQCLDADWRSLKAFVPKSLLGSSGVVTAPRILPRFMTGCGSCSGDVRTCGETAPAKCGASLACGGANRHLELVSEKGGKGPETTFCGWLTDVHGLIHVAWR